MSQKSVETPFWLLLSSYHFEQPKEYLEVFNRIPEKNKIDSGGTIYLALIPIPNVPLDEVARNLCKQILNYVMMVEKTNPEV